MKRRILSIFCVLALCLTLLPGTAWAAEQWTITLNGNTGTISYGGTTLKVSKSTGYQLEITGFSSLASSGELVLPTEAKTVNGGTAYTVIGIGASAFKSCSSLTSITVPDGFTIGNSAFYGCTNLKSVTLPSDLTEIASSLFRSCSLLTSITVPDGVTEIGDYAFRDCTSLTSIAVPDGVTSIGDSAFYGCTSLTSIELPESIANIDSDAFRNCTSLTDITLPEKLIEIGGNLFNGCTSLTSITVPGAVKEIGIYAFYKCTNLKEVTVLATTPPELNAAAFGSDTSNSLTAIYVPADSVEDYKGAENWSSLAGKIQPIVEESMTLDLASANWSGEYGTNFERKTFTIANVGNDALTISSVELSGTNADDFTLNTDGMANSLAANADTTFTVTPKADLGVGTYNATVTVTAAVGIETETKEATLTCTVNAKPLTGAVVEVNTSYTYDGTEKQPSGESVTVTLDGEPLTEDEDYELSYDNNTDAGEATVKATGKGNYTGTAEGHFTINQATPTVTDVAVSDSIGTIYDTTDISTIELTHGADDTPGTVALDTNQTLSAGSGTYNWTFTPNDTTNYTTTTGTITLTVEADTLKEIEVTKAPDKTEYTYGESFDKTGMVVTATYQSNATKNVTNEVTISPETLTVDVEELTISYGGQSVKQTITVNPKEISIASATVAGKTYDGNTDATVQSVTFSDDVQLTADDYTAMAEFSSKDANNSQSAAVKVTLSNNNYTFAGNNAEATFNTNAKISPLPVVLKWDYQTPFTYDGNSHSVTAQVTNKVDGDTLNLTYENNDKTAVGEYTAKVTAIDNANYTLEGAENSTQAWSIAKATPAYTVPTDLTATYGDTLADVTLPEGWAWDAPNTSVGDVGENTFSATFTPSDTVNYNTVTKNLTVAVSAKDITGAVIALGDSLTYTGQEQTQQLTSVTVDGLPVTYTVSGNTATDAGDYTLTITGTGNFTGKVEREWSIAKATYTGTTGVSGTVLANWPDKVTLPDVPAGASYGAASYDGSDGAVKDLSIEGGVLSYTGGESITVDQAYKITVQVDGGKNYEDYTITVTLTGTDKRVLTITGVTAQGGTYNGQTQAGYTGTPSAQGYTGDFTVTYNTKDGTAPTNAGTYTVTIAVPEDNAQYVGSMDLQFTIAPKALTVSVPSPSVYVGDSVPELALTYTGLVDGERVTPSEDPVFTITKSDDTVIALEDAVKTAGTYTITWSNAGDTTFSDGANYAIQTETAGTLTVSPRSTGGGGGGSSSNIITEITKNPDGSTTTTVTNKTTGTVTETTTWPDGSKEVIETKKDGTVTTTTTDTAGNQTAVVEKPDGSSQTTVSNKDGSGSVTVVDENGNVVSSATLSQSAVETAQAAGEAVVLPMPEVPVTVDWEKAPTITVDLPVGGSVKVEIPVEDVTPGTVAVLVKSNGDEEIIKTSVTTENGVAVTLNDGDTVKIVDNSRDFADVPDNYWGAEAVDFAVSRELFAGTSATTFAPNTAMTRAMIVTVLARFEGVDTSTGENWYDAGAQWAMENGVSDGTNMDASLTREQLATMLWRYAGSPSVSGDLSGYTDAGTVSSYAQQAMAWCVEHGIIGGTTATTLGPQGPATRVQVATILMRFIQANA